MRCVLTVATNRSREGSNALTTRGCYRWCPIHRGAALVRSGGGRIHHSVESVHQCCKSQKVKMIENNTIKVIIVLPPYISMYSPTRQHLGVLLILFSIASIGGSLAVSAVTSPDIAVDPNSNNSTERGRTLVGVQSEGQVAMLNAGGEPLWKIGTENVYYFDVTMLNNGSVLTGFLAENRQSCGQYEPPCSRTGFRIIDPTPKPRVISEWSFPVRTHRNSEVHDANLLPSGEILLTDMEYERIFTVAPNGTITWQWNGSEFYDAPPDPTRVDWLHINDVDRIDPGRYLVSVRNANQLLIIERGEGVVDVINEDEPGSSDANCRRNGDLADYNNDSNGDIRCGNPALLNHQHNPQYIGPNTILVADSENDRVVELHEMGGEWTVAWAVDSTGGIPFDWPRDADRLPNGNTLITDTRNNRIVEITPNGTAVWSTKTGIWPYDAERLPYGELSSDPRLERMNATSDPLDQTTDQSAIPLLEQVYAGLTFAFPLPHWVQPWHLGIVVFTIPLTCLGGMLIWSGRRKQ